MAQGTAFTYQGRLSTGTASVTGHYDFRFAVFDAATSGNQIGGSVNLTSVGVTNGLFTVTLDFGANVFSGESRWLDLAAKTNGSGAAFISMTPRQPLTPAPYAIRAAGADSVAMGVIGNAQLAPSAVAQSNLNISGTASAGKILSSTGNGLTWADPPVAAGAVWLLGGNGGTVPGTQFIGTTDNQPLEVRVNGGRALRIEPNANGAPNLIGGSPNNAVAPGVVGAFIGGGAAVDYDVANHYAYTNRIAADFGVISGGRDNTIQTGAANSVIGGGESQSIGTNADHSVVGGGSGNRILPASTSATIAGGAGNVIQNSAFYAGIGAGVNNLIQTNAGAAYIGGGLGNTIQTNASDAVISGGGHNTAGGQYATVPGGYQNLASGDFSLAGGKGAHALHDGSFVWSDSAGPPFASTATNQFLIRAGGGVGIGKNNPSTALDVNGTVSATRFAGDGSGLSNLTFVSYSSTNSGLHSTAIGWRSMASGDFATAIGVEARATGESSMALGCNVTAFGLLSTAMGFATTAGDFSTAMGHFAKATNVGCFVWADATSNTPFETSGDYQFLIRAAGGVGINTATPHYPLEVNGTTYAGGPDAGTLQLTGNAIDVGLRIKNSTPDGHTWALYSSGTGSGLGAGTFNIWDREATAVRLSIANNGNVGIGNTSPSAKLEVSGDVRAINFIGDGSKLANVWQLGGNAGTVPGTQFIGTIDNQPIEVHVNGLRALRLEPNTNGAPNVIGGSPNNVIAPGTVGAFIGGGGATNYGSASYANYAAGNFSFLGGGLSNSVQTEALLAVLGGGYDNFVMSHAIGSVLGGGYINIVQPNAQMSVLAGGEMNTILTDSSCSVVSGGFRNIASGKFSVVPGGCSNFASGTGCFAAGYAAMAMYDGDFVWADLGATSFQSTGSNQFLIRATGGVGINTNDPTDAALSVVGRVRLNDNTLYFRSGTDTNQGIGWYGAGRTFAGVAPDGPVLFGYGGGALGTEIAGVEHLALQWTPSSVTVNGTFNNNSDRNAKEAFAAVDPAAILDKVTRLPITEWSYKTDSSTRHVGPMAQDFHSAFNVGTDERHIAPIDEAGVALAAIQGLNRKLEQQTVELQRRDAEIEQLKQAVAELRKLLAKPQP